MPAESAGPDPAELRNEAAADLLNSANELLDSSQPAPRPGIEVGAQGSGSSDIAQDVSSVLGDDDPGSTVAADVSAVLGNDSNAATGSVGQDVSAVLADDKSLAPSSSAASASVALFAAAESYVSSDPQAGSSSPEEIAAADQQLETANAEVIEASASDAPAAGDEVTQQVESSLSSDEQSPSLGSWLEQNLEYVQSALSYAQQKTADAVADSTSDDPVTQKVNQIYYAANPFTGLGSAIAAADGSVPVGLYNYLNRIRGKTGELFGLIVSPDANQ